MNSAIFIGAIVCLLIWIIWFQLTATALILKDKTLTTSQRIAQATVVWLVPVFGAAILLRMSASVHLDHVKSGIYPPFGRWLAYAEPEKRKHGDGSGATSSYIVGGGDSD